MYEEWELRNTHTHTHHETLLPVIVRADRGGLLNIVVEKRENKRDRR